MIYGQEGGYGSVPKRKRGGVVLLVVLLLVALLIGGFYCYKQFFEKNAIEMLMSSMFDYLEASIEEEDYSSVTGDFSVQMKFQSSDADDSAMLAIFNKLDFSGSYGFDYDQSIMSIDFRSDYDSKDLFDFSLYTEYGRGYFYLDGLYDKYIDTSIDNYSEMFERKTDDYKSLVVGFRKAMENSLKDEYYVLEDVSVDGDKLTKTTLDLTGANYQEFNKSFFESLLADSNFVESYANIFDMDVEEVREELEDAIEDETEGMQCILYMDGISFVKFELNSDGDRLVVSADGKNKYDYQLFEEGNEFCSGSLEIKSDDNILVSYYDNEEEMGIELDINMSTKINGVVERRNVSNSISADEISDEDMMNIYNKLMENEGIVKIVEEVNTLFGYEDNGGNSSIITS